MQEREKTTKTRPRIRHYRPNDFILNSLQMHDSVHIQSLRIPLPVLNRQTAIQLGAVAEHEAQKTAVAKSSSTAKRKRSSTTKRTPQETPTTMGLRAIAACQFASTLG